MKYKKAILVIGGLLLVIGATRLPVQELRDYFSITGGTITEYSPVTNSSSAVGFSFNTTNSLSTSGAKLAMFENGGTNVFVVSPGGGLGVGPRFEDWYGVPHQDVYTVVSESFNYTGATSVKVGAEWTDENSVDQQAEFKVNASEVSMALYASNGRVTYFYPTINDGSTPYTLDTSLAHTSGNLLEVKNMGTNVYQFGYGGALSIQALPNQWAELFLASPDGQNSVDFFVDDTGPSLDLVASIVDVIHFVPSSGDGVTPYKLDTSITHTSGNLAEFNNNGTNYFNLNADQASTNTPITININGTLKRIHVGAPDSGGTGLRALTILN